MTRQTESLDTRLRALYQGLDTSQDFDARLMARVHAELESASAASAARALAEEARRYELMRRRYSWSGWIRRAVTLDTVGAAVAAGLVAHAIWTSAAARGLLASLGSHATENLTALGLLLALSTLPVLFIHSRRQGPAIA
jgi:hypothetical protein